MWYLLLTHSWNKGGFFFLSSSLFNCFKNLLTVYIINFSYFSSPNTSVSPVFSYYISFPQSFTVLSSLLYVAWPSSLVRNMYLVCRHYNYIFFTLWSRHVINFANIENIFARLKSYSAVRIINYNLTSRTSENIIIKVSYRKDFPLIW